MGEEKHKIEGKPKKRMSSVSLERGLKTPLKRTYEQSPRKRGRPPKDEKVCVFEFTSGVLWFFFLGNAKKCSMIPSCCALVKGKRPISSLVSYV